jgi:hypothetical protein
MFKSYSTDYSLAYPAREERLEMEQAFAPLVKSLKPGLSHRFPEAVKLHEHNIASGVYEHDKKKVDLLRLGQSVEAALDEKEPEVTTDAEVAVQAPHGAESAVSLGDGIYSEVAAPTGTDVTLSEPQAARDAVLPDRDGPDASTSQPAGSPVSEREVSKHDISSEPLTVPPALRQAMSDMDEVKGHSPGDVDSKKQPTDDPANQATENVDAKHDRGGKPPRHSTITFDF